MLVTATATQPIPNDLVSKALKGLFSFLNGAHLGKKVRDLIPAECEVSCKDGRCFKISKTNTWYNQATCKHVEVLMTVYVTAKEVEV